MSISEICVKSFQFCCARDEERSATKKGLSPKYGHFPKKAETPKMKIHVNDGRHDRAKNKGLQKAKQKADEDSHATNSNGQ